MTEQIDPYVKQKKALCGMLGLAKKAGKAVCGTDPCCESVRKKQAHLVLLAENASENTKKRVQNCCAYYQVSCRVLSLDVQTLSHALGTGMYLASVAITDLGFAREIEKWHTCITDNPIKMQEVEG